MKMVEKISRQMCLEAGYNPDTIMSNHGPRWRYYEPNALAALRALENPTPAMIDYFVSRALQVKIGGGYTWSDYARDQWQAMLQGAYHDDAMIAKAREG